MVAIKLEQPNIQPHTLYEALLATSWKSWGLDVQDQSHRDEIPQGQHADEAQVPARSWRYPLHMLLHEIKVNHKNKKSPLCVLLVEVGHGVKQFISSFLLQGSALHSL
eukprot:1159871-Pelagomonas_calceolata.AAC.14